MTLKNPDHEAKRLARLREVLSSPEERQRKSEHMKKMLESPKLRAKWSKNRRKEWKNPEIRERRLKGIESSAKVQKHRAAMRTPEARAAFSERGKIMAARVNKETQRVANKKVGDMLRGREQTAPLLAKGEGHWKALYWKIRSPEGIVFEGKNLNEIVRRNEHLFLPEDVIWKKSRCRASHGIRQLFEGRANNPVSWKGWTAVMNWHPSDDPLERPLAVFPNASAELRQGRDGQG